MRKVKLCLKQPDIMCSGRSRVSCHYHGKVLCENHGYAQVLIKSRGQDQLLEFTGHECVTTGFENVKMVWIDYN